MKVQTSTPFHILKASETVYFCSRHCLEKFGRQEGLIIDPQEIPVIGSSRYSFLQNKNFIITAILVGLCLLSFGLPILVPFRETLLIYVRMIWWAILLGLAIGGVIDHYVPREVFTYLLARPQKRTIFYAVALGFLMSVCNHGILAIAMQLHKKGASTPAIIAFLLASPWANFPLTIMLIGFFGVTKALYIILSAIIVALVTGFIYQGLAARGWIEKNQRTAEIKPGYSLKQDLTGRIRGYRFSVQQIRTDLLGIFQGALALGDMVVWWILVGTGLASLFGAYVPAHIFHQYMGPTTTGLWVTLAFATVIETCSEGSSPLAFEIFRQTGAVGNSLVFLMAGVVTDYTEIGLIWYNIGRRAALWLPIITVPQVMALGILANVIF